MFQFLRGQGAEVVGKGSGIRRTLLGALLLLLLHHSRLLLLALLHRNLLIRIAHSHGHLGLAWDRRRLHGSVHLLGESALHLVGHATRLGHHV